MKKNTTIFVTLTFLFALFYSIVRYHIFKEVPWIDFPLYIMNKVVSFSAIIYIAIYLILEKRNYNELSTKIRKYAKNLIFIHLIISLILLTPSYYHKFFNGMKFNFIGQLSLFAGVIALGMMNSLKFAKTPNPKVTLSSMRKYGTELLLFLISLHLFVMGYQGWLTPGSWPGGMPPITMLAFVVSISPLLVKKKVPLN